jgi:hypothetical protein
MSSRTVRAHATHGLGLWREDVYSATMIHDFGVPVLQVAVMIRMVIFRPDKC